MSTIYQLTEELRLLYEMATDPDIDPEVLKDTIEAVGGEFEIKADGYAKVMAEIDGDIASVKAEIERLSARKKTMENSKDRIKKSLESAMIATGKVKFKTNLFSFGIQKNPPSLKLADHIDMDLIPSEFIKIADPEIDKAKVKEAIKAGQEFDWARLESSEGLRIR